MRRLAAVTAILALACTAETPAPVADTACFGTRILSYRDLVAEVVIPAGESCASGTVQIVFTRGTDTLQTLSETRSGTVGFIGTADVDGDGRGEFFVATYTEDSTRSGTLYAYTDGVDGIARFNLAPLTAEQLAAYAGNDRFGFGGANQLVRAFPNATTGDTLWFGYSHGETAWQAIERPSWLR
jgi:hypothetical protein